MRLASSGSVSPGGGFRKPIPSWTPRVSSASRRQPQRHQPPGTYDLLILQLLKREELAYEDLERCFGDILKTQGAVLLSFTFYDVVKRLGGLEDLEAFQALKRVLLHWLVQFHRTKRLINSPRVVLYGMAMQRFATSVHPNAGEMAEQFLDDIEKLVQDKKLPFQLNAVIYNMAMKPFAKRGNAQKAQHIFDRCLQDFNKGNETARPTAYTWNILIDAHAKSGHPDAGEKASLVLIEMRKQWKKRILKESPNTVCYNATIDAWANSKNPDQAEVVLEMMYDDYLNQGNARAQPDRKSFSAVLKAHAQSKTLQGAEKAENILNLMIRLTDDGTLTVGPDAVSYATVASAYGRLGLPRDALRLLTRQSADFEVGNVAARPNLQSFLPVLEGWFKSKEAVAGEEAEKILDRMEHLHQTGSLKQPLDVFTYSAVMKAWGVVGRPERAQLVFQRMLEDCETGNQSAKPNAHSYSILLNAFSIAQLPRAGILADRVFGHMERMKVRPDLPVYRAALQCWRCSMGHIPAATMRHDQLQMQYEYQLKKSGSKQ